MDEDSGSPAGGKPATPGTAPAGQGVEGAFDVWLQQRLHQLYDGVTREPIPPELLRLITDDMDRRRKRR